MKTYKNISSLVVALFISLTASSTASACMLASGCEGDNFNLYTSLNEGHEDTEEAELAPSAFIGVRNNSGNTDHFSGTTKTVFTFDGNSSYDNETSSYQLEVRFDFENDGKTDTFYSRNKSASHTYETPGEKTIKMEVLDKQGNVSTAYTKVKVVTNTPPDAFFTVSPYSGTPSTVFTFDTKSSRDSQYSKNLLEYRFDWESDGKYDTKFSNKLIWNHKFENSGIKVITLQVRDPEGSTSNYQQKVTINPNTPPTAVFTATEQTSSNSKAENYKLDAKGSKDTDGGNLLYMWDFNYTGENDIITNTTWSSSPNSYATFYRAGEYLIKLIVKDKDGATDSSIIKIVVDLISTKSK